MAPPVRPTLFEFAGGEAAFLRLAQAHHGPPRYSQDAGFRAALHGYVRWAVDDVLAYAPVDAVVPASTPVPRWGWDGPQPA